MDILVIGVSSVFCRRVLPALLSLDCVGQIHLASRRPEVEVEIPQPRRGRCFCGYLEAFRELAPCLAYISLPNHMHGEWSRHALSAGFHVVVDKPALLNLADTESLLTLAQQQSLCVAEANVWPFHPQVSVAREAFSDVGSKPYSIQAVFSFPPLPASNFRNSPHMGGGSFYDLGPYAVSPGRVFFGEDPIDVWCRILNRNVATGLDTGFVITTIYKGGRVFQGYFSFETEYKNSLAILGPGISIIMDPVFTVSQDLCPDLIVRASNETNVVTIPKADIFALFFKEVINSIQAGKWSCWHETLLHDARVLHRAADASLVGSYDN